jgi:hypothetical protein
VMRECCGADAGMLEWQRKNKAMGLGLGVAIEECSAAISDVCLQWGGERCRVVRRERERGAWSVKRGVGLACRAEP